MKKKKIKSPYYSIFIRTLLQEVLWDNLQQIEEPGLKLILKHIRMDVLKGRSICIPLSFVVHWSLDT